MDIFRIIGIGLLTCVVALIIKQIRPEFYIVVVITGSIVILFMIVDELRTVFEYFLSIFNKTNLNYELFSNMLKIIGVGFLTEFANGICVDTGNASIGEKVVIAGKILILCLALPIISSLLDVIIEILP